MYVASTKRYSLLLNHRSKSNDVAGRQGIRAKGAKNHHAVSREGLLGIPERGHAAFRGRLGQVRHAVVVHPKGRVVLDGRDAVEGGRGGREQGRVFAGEGGGRRQELAGVLLHVGVVLDVQARQIGAAKQTAVRVAESVPVDRGAALERVKVVERVGQEILHLGNLAGRRGGGGQGRDVLRSIEFEAAVALGLAVVGRGKVGRLTGELQALVIAPVNRSGAQSGAEHGLLVIRQRTEEIGAVGDVRGILDAREVQGRQLAVELGKGGGLQQRRSGLRLGPALRLGGDAFAAPASRGRARVAARSGTDEIIHRAVPHAGGAGHRVDAVELIRPAFLRGLGVLIRRLVVPIGVKRQHGVRVCRIGAAPGARAPFGALGQGGRSLVRVGLGNRVQLGLPLV